MKTIKTFTKVSLVLVMLLLMISCEDMLDVPNPNAITTEDFWTSADDALYGVNAVYATLNGQPADLRMADCLSRTDEHVSYYAWTDAADFYNNKIPTGIGYDNLYNSWPFNETYASIFQANQALAKIPDIDMEEDLKMRYLGEVKFIRAYHFFNLTTLWGNVPFADGLKGDQTAGYPAKTIEDLWILMEDDLKYAVSSLPLKYDENLFLYAP